MITMIHKFYAREYKKGKRNPLNVNFKRIVESSFRDIYKRFFPIFFDDRRNGQTSMFIHNSSLKMITMIHKFYVREYKKRKRNPLSINFKRIVESSFRDIYKRFFPIFFDDLL